MRQVVTMARSIKKRKDLDWYTSLCTSAAAAGSKVSKSFTEIFPEYDEQEPVVNSQETATLLDRLAKEQLARLEAKHSGKSK